MKMKVIKGSKFPESGNAIIYPFLGADSPREETLTASFIQTKGDAVTMGICVHKDVFHFEDYSIEQSIQLLKALQEAINLAQYNRHQAQLSADAKAVQE